MCKFSTEKKQERGFLLLQNALKLASVHVEFQKFLGGDTPEPPLRDWTQVTEHSAFSFPNVGIYAKHAFFKECLVGAFFLLG